MKILVRNLARATTEDDLKALFTPFGAVQYCKIVMDEETEMSKGFGFIEMPKVGEAKAAIQKLNNTTFDDVRIRVKKAQNKAGPSEAISTDTSPSE